MKKKITVIALAVALIAIVTVGGTLAWFTDEDSATNVFTVGSVDIEQIEVFDDTDAMLIPVVGDDPTAAGDNYIEKNVTVKNVGKNPAYLRTLVAVPACLDQRVVVLYDVNAATNGWTKLDGDTSAAGVQPVYTNVTITGEALPYNVYVYQYDSALAVGATTAACLEYVYIDKTVDHKLTDTDADGITDLVQFKLSDDTVITEFDATGELNVYVATQAIQSEGFASADAALANFTTHPW